MTAKSNILEGLHVLLVSEDEARVSTLAKALRDRKASVGDVKVRSRDALALRGADLVVVDTRSAEGTKATVHEMRADVRARWASIAHIDYAKLVLDDGAVMLASLESEVSPLVTADRELTERARTEESFSVSLRPLGPSRMLRALAAAGPTMHVEIFHETLSGSVDLSNELLVCAFAERGTSEKWEAWTALVRILGLLDATVHVSRKSHPAAMNIMEPIDQALEVAAQERHSSAELIAIEERTARARVADDGARTGSHPAMRADGSFVVVEPAQQPEKPPEKQPEQPPALAAEKVAPSPKRTLLGVAAPALPDDLPALAKPKTKSRYAYHADGNSEKTRPSPSRTLLGVAPGALPALGGMPRPVVNLAVPSNMAKAARSEAAPSLPVPANTQTQVQPAAKPFVEELPTSRHPVMLDAAREAFAAADRQERRDEDGLLRHDTRTVPFAAVQDGGDHDTMPPDEPDSAERDETLVSNSQELKALREESGQHATLKAPDLMPLDDDLPADLAAMPASHLLAAIGEEVASSTFSDPPGAKPIPAAQKKPRVPVQETFTRFVRKPRTLYLLVILLLSVTLSYFVIWTERRTEELEARIRALTVVPPTTPSATAKIAPKPAPESDVTPAPEGVMAAAAGSAAAAPEGRPAVVSEGAANAVPVPTPAPVPAAAATSTPPVPAKPTPAEAVATPPVAVAQPTPPPTVVGDVTEPKGTDSVDGLVRAGGKLLTAGNAKEARDEFARAVAGDGKNPHAREGLAEALLALGQPRDALVQIEEAIKLRPRRVRYRVLEGDALQALGKGALAKEAWKKAFAIDPSDRETQKRLNL